MLSTSYTNLVDSLRYTNAAFLENDALGPTESPDYSFGSLGVESLHSIVGTTSTTDVLGAFALGTDKVIHDLKTGGEFGNLHSGTVHLDTIEQELYIQSTPQTSRIRVKGYCEACPTHTKWITFNRMLVR